MFNLQNLLDDLKVVESNLDESYTRSKMKSIEINDEALAILEIYIDNRNVRSDRYSNAIIEMQSRLRDEISTRMNSYTSHDYEGRGYNRKY